MEKAPGTSADLVRRTVRRQRRPLTAALLVIGLWQVCEAMVPVMIGVVVDRAVATGDPAVLAPAREAFAGAVSLTAAVAAVVLLGVSALVVATLRHVPTTPPSDSTAAPELVEA